MHGNITLSQFEHCLRIAKDICAIIKWCVRQIGQFKAWVNRELEMYTESTLVGMQRLFWVGTVATLALGVSAGWLCYRLVIRKS
jgi:hypothetical protein